MSDTLVTPVPPAADDHDEKPARDPDVTVHLCSGVYVDREFRDLVIRGIHNQVRHRVAPSYGFDLVPVVRHAWRSWFFDAGYLLVVLGVLIAGLVFGGALPVVLVLCTVAFCLLLTRIIRDKARAMAERLRFRSDSRKHASSDPDPRGGKRFAALLVVVAVAPVMSYLSGTSLRSAAGPAVVIASVLVACAVLGGITHRLLLVALARTRTLRPESLTRREKLIDEQQDHLCVIYERPPHRHDDPNPLDAPTRDTPSPFPGSGKLVNRWLPPLTVQLLRPGTGSLEERDFATPPFAAHSLVEALRRSLRALTTDTGSASLPGLKVRDRVYIAAPDFPANGDLVHNSLGKLELWRIIDDHRLTGHHFLETSVPIYDGMLMATVLIRVSLKGRSLSLDVATCALTRIPLHFHVIDRYGALGGKALVRSAARFLRSLPKDILRIWQVAELPVVLGGAWWARRDRMAKPRRHGIEPLMAVRQEVADEWRNAKQDHTTIHDHMRLVEQRILKATEAFLRDHGVDTSMFEKQATSIINSGVLNMGNSQMNVNGSQNIDNSGGGAEGTGT